MAFGQGEGWVKGAWIDVWVPGVRVGVCSSCRGQGSTVQQVEQIAAHMCCFPMSSLHVRRDPRFQRCGNAQRARSKLQCPGLRAAPAALNLDGRPLDQSALVFLALAASVSRRFSAGGAVPSRALMIAVAFCARLALVSPLGIGRASARAAWISHILVKHHV